MELKILLRCPQKIIISIAFLIAASTAAMLLFLQSFIDKAGIDYAEEYYSYVGTVRQSNATVPDAQPISGEALNILQASDCLSEETRILTYKGKAEGLDNIVDMHINFNLSDYCIFTGIVREISMTWEAPLYIEELGSMEIEKLYAGAPNLDMNDGLISVSAIRELGSENPVMTYGERYLVIGRYAHNEVFILPYGVTTIATEPEKIWPGSTDYDEKLMSNSIVHLPGMTAEQAALEGERLIEERGLSDYITIMNTLGDRVTVHGVSNMEMLISFADGNLFYNEGRGLLKEDSGKRVCVISSKLAATNNLSVGDSIDLKLLGKGYVSDKYTATAGVESGFPQGNDIPDEFNNTESDIGSFEIVGLYSFAERGMLKNYYTFSFNDIFIPESFVTDEAYEARPYNYSFRIQGKDYNTFLDKSETELMELGYSLHVMESEWPEVEGMYASMLGRYRLSVIGAVAAFCLVVFAYAALLIIFYRKEFALRRMLGTNNRRARRSFNVPFFITTIAGFVSSVIICYIRSANKQPGESELIAFQNSITDNEIFKILILIAIAGSVLAYIVLQVLIVFEKRKSLQRLLAQNTGER